MFRLLSRLLRDSRPRILLLADKRDWVFGYVANEINNLVKDKYHIDIRYVGESPKIRSKD